MCVRTCVQLNCAAVQINTHLICLHVTIYDERFPNTSIWWQGICSFLIKNNSKWIGVYWPGHKHEHIHTIYFHTSSENGTKLECAPIYLKQMFLMFRWYIVAGFIRHKNTQASKQKKSQKLSFVVTFSGMHLNK